VPITGIGPRSSDMLPTRPNRSIL